MVVSLITVSASVTVREIQPRWIFLKPWQMAACGWGCRVMSLYDSPRKPCWVRPKWSWKRVNTRTMSGPVRVALSCSRKALR